MYRKFKRVSMAVSIRFGPSGAFALENGLAPIRRVKREIGAFLCEIGACRVSTVQRNREISFNLALRARERPLRLSGGRQLVPDIRGALLVKFGGNPGVYRAVIALNIVRSKISSARAFRSSAICRASSSVIQAKSSFFTLKMTTLLMIGTPWSSHP